MDGLLVLDPATPFDQGGVVHQNLIGNLIGERCMVMPDLPDLAVKPCWEKIEFLMFKAKSPASLRDAPFSKEKALGSGSKGVTDERPLFEGNGHSLKLNSSSILLHENQSLFQLSSFSFQVSNLTPMRHAFDLHLHTYYSSDGCASPEAMVEAAKRRGLSGIAVTDHNTCEAVDHLMRVGLIREDGTAVDGFLVIPGVEVSTADGHLICLGTTLPFMKGRPALEVVTAIHERGGIAIAPHPFDSFRAGIREEVLNLLPLDALEVFNSAVSLRSFNERATLYAAQRGLTGTSSSDAHHASAAGLCSTAYDLPELTLANVLAAIPKGGERKENYLCFAEAMKKNMGNWFRFFNPAPKS